MPNRLFAGGCRRPVALAVFARLASTPHIWTARGSLQPYEVRASRAALEDATGATAKEVRGALAWLIRGGFLERRDTSRTAAAVYRVITGAKHDTAVTDTASTTSAPPRQPEGPSLPEKGQAKGQAGGQDGAKVSAVRGNGLGSYPQQPRAQPRAQVFKDVEDNTTTPPPSPPPQRGGILKMWAEAFDGTPPAEPRATHNADRYRRAVLERATAGESPEDVRRMFASWVAATDPDWGGHDGGGVGAFAAAVGRWTERRDIERAHRRRATVTDPPGDRKPSGGADGASSLPPARQNGTGGIVREVGFNRPAKAATNTAEGA